MKKKRNLKRPYENIYEMHWLRQPHTGAVNKSMEELKHINHSGSVAFLEILTESLLSPKFDEGTDESLDDGQQRVTKWDLVNVLNRLFMIVHSCLGTLEKINNSQDEANSRTIWKERMTLGYSPLNDGSYLFLLLCFQVGSELQVVK
ncbi:hypothetical protein Taro_019921 [Colocasia esculenta]|uniref:Uncharacterized protein n=1 Tax=Colocasia esculenta TaxID=4460 RepID=A0A843V3M3_COLES|nr:hypothetical protein [Colocasia esculenta]